MDIVDLFPLLIFAALYFFGSSKKRAEEKAKKKAAQESPHSSPTESPSTDGGLQQRLGDALRKMEQRIETESAGELDKQTVLEKYKATDQIQAQTSFEAYDAESASDNIYRLPVDTPHDNDLFDGGVVKMPGHDGFTVALDDGRPKRSDKVAKELAKQYDFNSLLDEVPNETYHGHGFGTFNVAHGLHYGEEEGTRSSEADPVYQAPIDPRTFRSIDELRRAVVVAEILDKPVSTRKR